MKKGNIIINAKKGTDTVDVRLYGLISEWTDVNGNRLSDQIAQYEGKYKKLNIYLNSNGGSVIEGIALFNILKRTKMEVSIYVDGVAASMASVLLQLPNAKRYMARFTRVMLHRVSGMAFGSVDDLRSAVDMMEGFEADLITIISERTGKSIEDVKNTWFDGKDHWLTPQQALDNKLIDGIIDGKVSREAQNITAVPDLVNFYSEQITNFNNHNNDKMDLTNIINRLGMPAGSELPAIEAKVEAMVGQITSFSAEKKKLEDKIKEFENKAKTADEARIKDLVDNAVTAKKITEAQRETYTTLATANYDSTKTALEAMSTPQNLADFTNGGNSPVSEERKTWTFQDWQKKDGKGLENLRDNHKEVYNALKEQAFPSQKQ